MFLGRCFRDTLRLEVVESGWLSCVFSLVSVHSTIYALICIYNLGSERP